MVKFVVYEVGFRKVVRNSVSKNSKRKGKPSKHKGWRVGFESLSAHNKKRVISVRCDPFLFDDGRDSKPNWSNFSF